MRSAAFAVMVALLGVASALPPWYQCDPATCTPPNCHCASSSAPGGLAPADTPQFILITHDDAITAYSNKVMRSITDVHTNPNGCNVPATWYTLQLGSDCEIAKQLYEQNHELALHTVNHAPLVPNFQGDLEQEMMGVRTWLNATCGIPLEDLVGFRAPYLVHNEPVREVLADNNILYDATMISVFQAESDVETAPGQRTWPFTMDNGIPIDCNWNYPDGQCERNASSPTFERFPGLWEVPLWEMQNSTGGHLYTMDPEGDVYDMLVENFNMNYNGNRAPFGIFLHATWFTPEKTDAANRFLNWSMSQPDVWAVTTRQLLDWIQSPVPASQMGEWLTCNPVNFSDTPSEIKCQQYTIRVGDSAYTVATSFAVLTTDMLALNPELGDGDRLSVGQQVKIPPWDATCTGDAILSVIAPNTPDVQPAGPAAAPRPPAAPGAAPEPLVDASSGGSCRTHTVAPGEYWFSIGEKYMLSVEELVVTNPGTSAETALQVGQIMKIPPYPTSCAASKGPTPDQVAAPPAAPPPAAVPPTSTGAPLDLMNPSSGVNITMKLAGRTQLAFQTDLSKPFTAAVARDLGVSPTAVKLMEVRPETPSAGRRLKQATNSGSGYVVTVVLRVASSDPVGLYNNATTTMAKGGQWDSKVLATYGLALVEDPQVVPFLGGQPMEVAADGTVVEPAPPEAAQEGDEGLSTGAIAGIAVGGVALVAAVAVAAVVLLRRRRKLRGGSGAEPLEGGLSAKQPQEAAFNADSSNLTSGSTHV